MYIYYYICISFDGIGSKTFAFKCLCNRYYRLSCKEYIVIML